MTRRIHATRMKWIVAAILYGGAGSAWSAEFGVGVGIVSGQITVEKDTQEKPEKFTAGGLSLAARGYFDHTRKVTSVLEGQILTDLKNSQVVRQLFGGGVSYHLLGGAKELSHESPINQISSSTPYAVSLEARAGLASYAAVLPDTDEAFSGSALEFKFGMSTRFDTDAGNSYLLEALVSTTALPASETRISYTGVIISLIWRF